MLWLCLEHPQLAVEALGLSPDTHWVWAAHGSQRWAISDSGSVQAGMPYRLAQLREPDRQPLPRDTAAETRALISRAQVAYGVGSPVVTGGFEDPAGQQAPRWWTWVEIGASARLFGHAEAIHQRLLDAFAAQDLQLRCGIAPTRMAAALRAQADVAAPLTPEALADWLDTQPLAQLPWPRSRLDTLQEVGLQRLAQLRALPRDNLRRRFGAALLIDLDRLYGLAPHPFEPLVPAERFERRLTLMEEIAHVEPLLFPLRRLLQELVAFLTARDQALTRLRLRLSLAWGAACDYEVRLLSASRALPRLLDPLREQLMQSPPPAPVRGLDLVADEWTTPNRQQTDLFDSAATPLDWPATLERLQARLGRHRLWTPVCVNQLLPEQAHRPAPPGSEGAAPPAASRPLWWLPQPQRLAHPPAQPGIGERIDSGWWDGPLQCRDYHWLDDARGRRCWLWQDRSGDPLGDAWWLQGLDG
jgi:protein ImuB